MSLLLEKYVALRVVFIEKSAAWKRLRRSCADPIKCARVKRAFVKSNYASGARVS